jgi:hypothetical protein
MARSTRLDQCCDQARADEALNPRHLWTLSDTERQYPDRMTLAQEEFDACMAVQAQQRPAYPKERLPQSLRPGSWTVEDADRGDGAYVRLSDHRTLATFGTSQEIGIGLATACLIAAAPDLVDALEQCCKAFETQEPFDRAYRNAIAVLI